MASLWTFWAWVLAHAVVVLAGICAALLLCSAILALCVHNLRRQLKSVAENYKMGTDTLLNRMQALDDRIAVVALTAAQGPPNCPPSESSSLLAVVPRQDGKAAVEAFEAIREQVVRLTTQFAETDDPEGQDFFRTSESRNG